MQHPVSHDNEGVFVICGSGGLEPEVIEHLRLSLFAHPEFTPGSRALFDCRGMDVVDMDQAALQRLDDFDRQYAARWQGCRVAVVMPSLLGLGSSRQFELKHETTRTFEFGAFNDYDAAHEWLLG